MVKCHGTMHSNRYQSSKFIGSSESGLELSDQAGGIYGTGCRCPGGDADQMLETTIQMQQLLQFIWKHRSIFDVTERVEICGVAKAYGGTVFDVFSQGFLAGSPDRGF